MVKLFFLLLKFLSEILISLGLYLLIVDDILDVLILIPGNFSNQPFIISFIFGFLLLFIVLVSLLSVFPFYLKRISLLFKILNAVFKFLHLNLQELQL
jgi:hypothetical protein